MARPARCTGALALLVCLASCGQSQAPQVSKGSTPFVFQALNLRQQNSRGQLQWLVTSPEARYDLSRRIALTRNLQGEIYNQGQPLYRLQASHGTVLNDGEVLQLEGDVSVQRLGADPVLIRADRMRWYPRQQRLELDRRAQASTRDLALIAQRATLLFDQDRLELRGQPELRKGDLSLRLQQLTWSPGRGTLEAPAPVVASRTGSNGPSTQLRASGLRGNTLQRRLLLGAPVLLDAPDQKARLQAQQSEVDLASNTISSGQAFTASVGPLQIRGGAFRLNLLQQTVSLPSGCQLQQPDASLRASQCSWNWQTQRVLASGGVVLRRRANQQLTRAQRMVGRLGPNGTLAFNSPGSRVQSTLRLPASRPLGRSDPAAIRL
jgi:LPS export ABC transporter protein LptC